MITDTRTCIISQNETVLFGSHPYFSTESPFHSRAMFHLWVRGCIPVLLTVLLGWFLAKRSNNKFCGLYWEPDEAHNKNPTSKTHWFIGLVSRVFVNGLGDLGSISGRVIPKILKMVLDTQKNKVRIKDKEEQSRERCSSDWKGSLRVALDYVRQLLVCT